jgi:NTP pyrophosphatase (non-canonical NTP hydrolase)
MDFSDYQRRSRATALYPGLGESLAYPALGLCGEAGEVAELVKKALRDEGGALSAERRDRLAQELGDVLWYLAQLTTEAGLDLDAIATANLEKLASRAARDRLHGDGDDR